MSEFNNNDTNANQISGEIRYYNTKDVAEELGESESTLRFWCENFKDSVEVKRVGRNRKFTKNNIEELKYIQGLLRDEGYSVEQVKEFLTKNETEIVDGAKSSEPLAIQALASAVMNEIEFKLKEMFQEEENKKYKDLQLFASQLIESQKELLHNVSEKIDSTIENKVKSIEGKVDHLGNSKETLELKQDVVALKKQLEEQNHLIKNQNELIEKQNQRMQSESDKAEERDQQLTELMKRSLENREQESKKGFFGKIFGK